MKAARSHPSGVRAERRPYRIAPYGAGLSHGLKTVHRTVFAAAKLPPPFRVSCPYHQCLFFVHTPDGMRPKKRGLSPELKKCPPDCFCGSEAAAALSSPISIPEKKRHPFGGASSFLGWIMGLEPTWISVKHVANKGLFKIRVKCRVKYRPFYR